MWALPPQNRFIPVRHHFDVSAWPVCIRRPAFLPFVAPSPVILWRSTSTAELRNILDIIFRDTPNLPHSFPCDVGPLLCRPLQFLPFSVVLDLRGPLSGCEVTVSIDGLVVSLLEITVRCGWLIVSPRGVAWSEDGSRSTLSRTTAMAENVGNEGELGIGVDPTDVGVDEIVDSREPKVGASHSLRASAKTLNVVGLLVMTSGEALGVTEAAVKLG